MCKITSIVPITKIGKVENNAIRVPEDSIKLFQVILNVNGLFEGFHLFYKLIFVCK